MCEAKSNRQFEESKPPFDLAAYEATGLFLARLALAWRRLERPARERFAAECSAHRFWLRLPGCSS